MTILEEIIQERKHQDEKWGGPKHDDNHEEEDWIAFIQEYLHAVSERTRVQPWRVRIRKIAALAMAAIESNNRTLTQREIYFEACIQRVIDANPVPREIYFEAYILSETKSHEQIEAILNSKQSFIDKMKAVLAYAISVICSLDERKTNG